MEEEKEDDKDESIGSVPVLGFTLASLLRCLLSFVVLSCRMCV